MMDAGSTDRLPRQAHWLGYAGLLPQLAVVATLAVGGSEWRFSALALGYAYAALILSFVGGLWWGLASHNPANAPPWIWAASVIPSLVALASAIPWTIGAAWPGPSLVLLGLSIASTLIVDAKLDRGGLCPPGWLALRARLSLGLGALTLLSAAL
jgi:hypothetical protein